MQSEVGVSVKGSFGRLRAGISTGIPALGRGANAALKMTGGT